MNRRIWLTFGCVLCAASAALWLWNVRGIGQRMVGQQATVEKVISRPAPPAKSAPPQALQDVLVGRAKAKSQRLIK